MMIKKMMKNKVEKVVRFWGGFQKVGVVFQVFDLTVFWGFVIAKLLVFVSGLKIVVKFLCGFGRYLGLAL